MTEKSYRSLAASALILGVLGVLVLGWSIYDQKTPRASSSTPEAGSFAAFAADDAPQSAPPNAVDKDPQTAPGAPRKTGEAARALDAPETPVATGGRGPSAGAAARAPGDELPPKSSGAPSTMAKEPSPAQDSAAQNSSSTISRQAIQQVLNEQFRPVAKRCYEQVIEQYPDAKVDGRVVVAFDIIAEGGEGRVELAELGENSTLFDDGLHDCMLSSLGDVVFPASDAKLRVNYPFNFATDDAAADE